MGHVIVFVLTMSFCVAPVGKTVCERDERTFSFARENDCVRARNLLVELFNKYPNVILYQDESICKAQPDFTVVYEDEETALKYGNMFLKIAVDVIGYD